MRGSDPAGGGRPRRSRRRRHLGGLSSQETSSVEPGKLEEDRPLQFADAVLNAVEKKTDVVYVSGKWRLVMLIIKTLPEAVFKKLKF